MKNRSPKRWLILGIISDGICLAAIAFMVISMQILAGLQWLNGSIPQ